MESRAQFALEAVRSVVKPRRIRIDDFFLSFESPGPKVCTATQFRRALDFSGVMPEVKKSSNVSEQDFESLIDAYRTNADGAKVDYASFCDAVNEVFTIKGLERNPTVPVVLARENAPMYYSKLGLGAPLSEDERSDLLETLLDLASLAAESGLDVVDIFVDFDRNNDGCITAAEFHRNVHRLHRGVTPSQAKALAKAYDVGNGLGVHFRAMATDMEAAAPPRKKDKGFGGASAADRAAGAAVSGAHVKLRSDEAAWAAAGEAKMREVEEALGRHVAERRVRLDDAFLAFDTTRRGAVSDLDFARGLRRTFAVDLSPVAMRQIADKYRRGEDSVDWKAFVKAIASEAKAVSGDRANGPGNADAALADMLREMRDAVANRRIQLKPTFQDFDPRRNQHVTRDQFERALAMFGLLPPHRFDAKALLDAYAARDGRHTATGFVNYAKFLRDINDDAPEDEDRDPDHYFHSEATLAASVKPAGR